MTSVAVIEETRLPAHPVPHSPVLLSETIRLLDPRPGETVVDGTLGAGGHALGYSEHPQQKIDAVTGELVDDTPAPGARLAHEAPALLDFSLDVARVLHRAEIQDRTERSRIENALGFFEGRRVAANVTDVALDPLLRDGLGQLPGLPQLRGQRLLDKHV